MRFLITIIIVLGVAVSASAQSFLLGSGKRAVVGQFGIGKWAEGTSLGMSAGYAPSRSWEFGFGVTTSSAYGVTTNVGSQMAYFHIASSTRDGKFLVALTLSELVLINLTEETESAGAVGAGLTLGVPVNHEYPFLLSVGVLQAFPFNKNGSEITTGSLAMGFVVNTRESKVIFSPAITFGEGETILGLNVNVLFSGGRRR